MECGEPGSYMHAARAALAAAVAFALAGAGAAEGGDVLPPPGALELRTVVDAGGRPVAQLQASSAAEAHDARSDPDLEPGFPASIYVHAGTYLGGAATGVTVGNVDADATLEIFASALATGPLHAWDADGTSLPGWPTSDSGGVEYVGLGHLSDADPGLEVATIDWGRRAIGSRLQA